LVNISINASCDKLAIELINSFSGLAAPPQALKRGKLGCGRRPQPNLPLHFEAKVCVSQLRLVLNLAGRQDSFIFIKRTEHLL
jgi:hypothetical protein